MILEQIHAPADVKALEREQLPQLCEELREFLVESVSKTGGHLASNLGAVELTVAIHRVFDTEKDRLVFDVGHQCYVHKVLNYIMDNWTGDSSDLLSRDLKELIGHTPLQVLMGALLGVAIGWSGAWFLGR